ncbi:MAG: DUF2339 domain-containing protein, partial [Rariglobus sp.]
MNVNQELDLLRRRIGLIEGDLGDAKKRLAALEARAAAEASPLVIAHDTPFVSRPVTEGAPVIVPAGSPVSRVEPPVVPVSAPIVPEVVEKKSPPPLPVVPPALPEPVAAPKWAPVAPTESTAFSWKPWLLRLQLWPPDDGENKEVRLGAWWATRVGMLLAVIGVVFFGVYVSLDTQPWVKFVELLTICAGVAAGGLWLERKIARFGAVVFSGGLALLYFCAFAGYALPAVKVLESAASAVSWQLAAIGLIVAAALKRRSPAIATMAVGFGYVTAVFSRSGGLHAFALVTALLLAVASVGFKRWLRWHAPAVIALPATYVIYALVLHGNWLVGPAPAAVWPWAFLVSAGVLFFLHDWPAEKGTSEKIDGGERWFQGTNSSLAVLLGVITALTLYRAHLAEFYFGAAALLGGLAWLRHRQTERDVVGAVFLTKAAGALTLGVIESVDGRTTALALLVQAWVMALSARKLESRVLSIGALLVSLIATAFFFRDAGEPNALMSLATVSSAAFVVALAWLASAWSRFFVRDEKGEAGLSVEMSGAVLAAAAGVYAIYHLEPTSWAPVSMMGLAVLLGVPALGRRAVAPWIAAGVTAAAAQAGLWILASSPVESVRLA